jgi:arylsulfatase A-like enzyme
MKRLPGRPWIGIRVLVALSCAGLLACETAETEPRWNALILVPDTVRADHLSSNGYPRSTSPALDALAREGANFSQAITVAPRTWQSFAAILTGLYPPHHGVRFLFDDPLSAETPTLATLLRERGYETIAFDSLPFLERITGGVGFDEYVQASLDPRRSLDEVLIDRASEWISRDRRAPFFVFVRMIGAHWPYERNEWTEAFEACEAHDHRFNEGTYGTGPPGRGKRGVRLTDRDARREQIWTVDFDEAALEHMIAHYDAKIRATDALIGRLIERLRTSGALDDTLVVVSSDHGESFGEHGYLQHGPRVDDAVMRVPLIIRLPQHHPSSRPGRVIDELVRAIDIAPTVLDALGVPVPDTMDGVTLLPAIRGESVPELWAYGESGRSFRGLDPERHLPGVAGKHRMVRTARFKLVFVPGPDGGEFRLFDLEDDPGERRDVAAKHSDAVNELRALLASVMADDVSPSRDRSLTADEIETLRALGYAD